MSQPNSSPQWEDDRDTELDGKHLPEFIEQSPLLRQIIFEKRFRIVLLLLLLGGIGLGLGVPRWTTTSPPGFTPVVRVSGLDRLQVWNLRRSAYDHAKAGRTNDAFGCWRLSLARNLCDVENHRAFLQFVLDQTPVPWPHQTIAVRQGLWLLRFNSTNAADLNLVAKVLKRFELDDAVVAVLAPNRSTLDPALAKLLVRSAFARGQMQLVEEVWSTRTELQGDAEMALYRTAWRAAWGKASDTEPARLALEKATSDPALQSTAHQLLSVVAYNLNQLPTFESSFQFLVDKKLDRLTDHARYWQLLARAGRAEEARKFAADFTLEPHTILEAISLGESLVSIGQDDDALRLFEKYRKLFPQALDLWRLPADVLVRTARWNELRAMVMEMRKIRELRSEMGGYIEFLDGVAHLNSGRSDLAETSFKKVPELGINHPLVGFQTATYLARIGQLEPARQLLPRLESAFGGEVQYWFQVQVAAYEAGDIDSMLSASEKAYALAPNNPVIVNNYAAALLMKRARPSEAIQLTLRKLTETPNDPGSKLNHTLALLQNSRNDEAAKLLDSLEPALLNRTAQTVYHLARFELENSLGRFDRAKDAASKIERRFLSPPQIAWMQTQTNAWPKKP